MLRKTWFQIHWFIGITAGVVLALVGLTGGMLSLEDQILRALNPGVITVTPIGERLSPQTLIARVEQQRPEGRVAALTLSKDPGAAARVQWAALPGERRGQRHYVNPYTGELSGDVRGEGIFRTVMQLHRWLLAGEIGKQIVGASTLVLVVLALSGLYLRWPRRLTSLRTWLTFKVRKRGRGFLWDLHAVVGTWVLPFYLLAALTGLTWSYDWYRDGLYRLSGVEPPQQRAAPAVVAAQQASTTLPAANEHRGRGAGASGSTPALLGADALWAAFEARVPQYRQATLRLPARPDQEAEVRYQSADAPHSRANDHLYLDPLTGAAGEHARYADKPFREQLLTSMLPLHSGEFFGLAGLLAMMVASLLMPLFAITGWLLYLDRRTKRRDKHRVRRSVANRGRPGALAQERVGDTGGWLVGFASQSGVAERLAWQTAAALEGTGAAVTVQPLSALDPSRLSEARRALFVVSTFRDGEPPDNARAFFRQMAQSPTLSGLRYGLLALGDRHYDRFCGFGRRLAEWLFDGGAEPLFDPIEVDAGDPAALALWRQRVDQACGQRGAWAEQGFQIWRLRERRCLNPQTRGLPTYYLALASDQPGQWQAGDIAEVRLPPDQPSAEPECRDYSIASLPGDGQIELLVRQVRHADGGPGKGSGWLTTGAAIGEPIALRIRRNPTFHGPGDGRPLILIGNGTGLAGLRSHLKERIAAGHRRNWLLFGERSAACDFYFAQEIRGWLAEGAIQRLDLAFSRDQVEPVYVQQRLRDAADTLRAWVAADAAVYVCGSMDSMAPAVEQALDDILGADTRRRLAGSGAYRRDVY